MAFFWKNTYPCKQISAWEMVALVDAMICGIRWILLRREF